MRFCLLFLSFLTLESLKAITNADSIIYDEGDSLIILQNLRYAPQPDSLNGDVASDKILDLYLPNVVGEQKLPVLIFVHGGGFAGGDKEGTADLCSKIATKGFAVISINYWLTLKHKKIAGASATANMAKGVQHDRKFHPGLKTAVRNASDDLVLVLQWIRRHQEAYNLDISKVALSGGSAGAMTVLYTAYVSEQKVLPIRAVIDLWGGLEDEGVIKRDSPPVLIYHGDKDKLIHVDYAYALKERMDEIGNTRSVLHIMEGKGHARYDIIRNEKINEISKFLHEVLQSPEVEK